MQIDSFEIKDWTENLYQHCIALLHRCYLNISLNCEKLL